MRKFSTFFSLVLIVWTLNLNAQLPAPSLVQNSFNINCGESATFEIDNPDPQLTYLWYADDSGTDLIHTGEVFETDNLTINTNFWVNAVDGLIASGVLEFTNAGASGRFGPSQAQIDAEYTGTSLDGSVTVIGDGIQEWTVPFTGTYTIDAYGAQGGFAGGGQAGLGARISGEFDLIAGQKVHIIVGQQGGQYQANTRRWQSSGGGGSFVVLEGAADESDILVIAGGGGGYAHNRATNNVDGQAGPNGGNGSGNTSSSNGGSNGSGGLSSSGGNWGGGGGFIGDGTTATSRGGRSFLNGGLGGTGTVADVEGGFGGGGGVTRTLSNNTRRGAGGGGYSGGGAAHSTSTLTGTTGGAAGGGGGSYNNGLNQINESGIRAGDGLVVISYDINNINDSSPLVQVDVTVNLPDEPIASTPAPIGCGSSTILTVSGSTGEYVWFEDAAGTNQIGTGSTFETPTLSTSTTFYVAAIPVGGAEEVFTFTNCGAIGREGPDQSAADTEYTGTNLDGEVTVVDGIQYWTVPETGTYRIEAYGAQGSTIGGTSGGLGAYMSGDFELVQGEVIQILVGQNAPNPGRENLSSSGGGGSFVTRAPHNTNASILLIAGGGGGTGAERPATSNGTIETFGQTGSHGSGGTNGNGGTSGDTGAGAGAGFFTNGASTGGGIAYIDGGFGGVINTSWSINGGGFGGGGSVTGGGNSRYGGGGGYSGGSGSSNSSGATTGLWGGGGGSFNNGLNQNNISGIGEGHGLVIITSAGSGCLSNLVPVEVTVVPLQEPTVANIPTINCGGTAILNASGSSADYVWFSDANGTNQIGVGSTFETPVLTDTTTFYVASIPVGGEEKVFTFTNCGAIGREGPDQAAADAEYAGTTLDGEVTIADGIQLWTVPATGIYRIEAYGAQGSTATGSSGGLGAYMSGDFELIEGEVIQILVGQNAPNTPGRENLSSSGGGGSFITRAPHNTNASILLIAGGGGGTGDERPATSNGTIETFGQTGTGGSGGTNGNGGLSGNNAAGAGGGFFTDGAATGGGIAYIAGGFGGSINTTYSINGGGFGGGGSPTSGGNSRYGGGGGYSGGSGATSASNSTTTTGLWGGGGGSFNSGLNQNNISGIGEGHGLVIITAPLSDCISNLVPVEVPVTPLQEPVTAPTLTINCAETAILTASGSPDDYAWFADAAGNELLGTGSPFETVFYQTTTIFVASTQGPCISDLVPVNVTVISPDDPIVVNPLVTIDCGDTAVLEASGSNGNFVWYDNQNNIVGSGASFTTPELTENTTFFVGAADVSDLMDTLLFSPAGATGPSGPSQLQVDNAYSGSGLDGQITIIGDGIQQWIVPQTATYTFEAYGAEGGNFVGYTFDNPGKGAKMRGEFDLIEGDTIRILVGQKGGQNTSAFGGQGGGGGTFIVKVVPNSIFQMFDGAYVEPLIVAGGGAGAPNSSGTYPVDARIDTRGSNFSSSGNTNSNSAGGGGSFEVDGGGLLAFRGFSFLSGGLGGDGAWTFGGFGGGGGKGGSFTTAGGGGGFDGGDFVNTGSANTANGGGSFNAGNNQDNIAGYNEGDGLVNIFYEKNPLCVSNLIPVAVEIIDLAPPTVSTPTPFLCGGTSTVNASGSTGEYVWFADENGTNIAGFGSVFETPVLTNDTIFWVAASSTDLNFAGSIFEFTNAGATGRFGPSQTDINTAYAGTTLEGQVNVFDGIQKWQVPVSGIYRIDAYGAEGGNNGGLGAKMSGDFYLTAGEVIQVLVGQQGGTNNNSAGGGGGSFVVRDGAVDESGILVIAGGGGGYNPTTDRTPLDGKTQTAGSDGDRSTGVYAGGANGGGGESQQNVAGGGGGFSGDGINDASGRIGISFLNGGAGGNQFGGFGGGAGANTASAGRTGGGGGYSGGGAGFNGNGTAGSAGGGGSFNSGNNQDNESGVKQGHGLVVITSVLPEGCLSDLVPVNISVDTIADPIVTNVTICENETATLNVSGSIGNFIWYSDNQGNNQLAVGDEYTTPPLTATTTYYVAGVNDESNPTCFSAFIPVIVSVASLTGDAGTLSGDQSICTGTQSTFSSTSSGGTWSSSDETIAEVEPLSGIVSGISQGTTTITYTIGGGCIVDSTATRTVNVSQPNIPVSVNTETITDGDFLWNGNHSSDWANSNNWYVLSGSVYLSPATPPTNNSNVFVVNTTEAGQCISGNNPVINDDNQLSRTLNIGIDMEVEKSGAYELHVNGSWNNQGTFTHGSGSVIFTGDNSFYVISGNSNFYDLHVDNQSGELTILDNSEADNEIRIFTGKVIVSPSILVEAGRVQLDPSTELELQTGSDLDINY